MKSNNKYLSLIILILIIVFTSAALIIIKNKNINTNTDNADTVKLPEPVVKDIVKNIDVPKQIEAKAHKKIEFKTNEEIKKEYGRVEIVSLYNGKSYTGAVISIDDFYSIVTIQGLKKIPMEDVKSRIILE